MKYVKVIHQSIEELENHINAFYQECEEKKHRVLTSKMEYNPISLKVIFVLVVDDNPKRGYLSREL